MASIASGKPPFYDHEFFGPCVGNNTIPSFTEGKNRSHQVLNHFDVDNPFWAALRSAILNATAELRVDLSTK
ncbi:hypothetical protein Goarm_005338, partial [Gossypium armourianum]|nr:hypothetical protein [Gossypium armourianum]